MKGIPDVFNTKQDWINTYDYLMKPRENEDKTALQMFLVRLQNLLDSKTHKVLKPGAVPTIEEGYPLYDKDDFEVAENPHGEFARIGITEKQIKSMITKIKEKL